MYAVEYRRFYLRDLESVLVWPSRTWLLRPLVPGVLLGGLGVWLWNSVSSTSGEIFCGLAFAWVILEQVLGPTAKSRIRTTGMTVELPLVKRTRRAAKVLAKIDAAVRATRIVEPVAAPTAVTEVTDPSMTSAPETNAS
jgi:hypothetical protein